MISTTIWYTMNLLVTRCPICGDDMAMLMHWLRGFCWGTEG